MCCVLQYLSKLPISGFRRGRDLMGHLLHGFLPSQQKGNQHPERVRKKWLNQHDIGPREQRPDRTQTWKLRLETLPGHRIWSLAFSLWALPWSEPYPVLPKARHISSHGPPVGELQTLFHSTRHLKHHQWILVEVNIFPQDRRASGFVSMRTSLIL